MSDVEGGGDCPTCGGFHPAGQKCPRASRAGEVVAEKYRISKLLGEGGMGVVYEARHELIGRRFAVKFLHPDLAVNAQIFARFRREARAAGAIENENIAAVTDFGTAADGAPFIVMEYLDGEDLARLLARAGPLSVSRAVHAVIQACRGLAAAHANGIVHRDLKPENLFVIRRGDGADLVKVLDFGIAKLKAAEAEEGASTRTGTTMGTAFYMPPEQARGQKDIDERADIYALGVILYELLSNQKPHGGDTYNAVLYHILTQPAERLETLRRGLPAGLSDVVHRAMAFAPGDRFASVQDLAAALAPFAGRALTPTDPGAPTSRVPHATTRMTPSSVLDLPAAPAAAGVPVSPGGQVSVQPTVAGTVLSPSGAEVRAARGKPPWVVGAFVLVLGAAVFAVWGWNEGTGATESAGGLAGAASVASPKATAPETSPPSAVASPPATAVSSAPAVADVPAASSSGAPVASAAPEPPPTPAARHGAVSKPKSAVPASKPPVARPAPAPAAAAPPAGDDDPYRP